MERPSDEPRDDAEADDREGPPDPDGDGSRGVSRSTDEETPWRFGIDEVGDDEATVDADDQLPRPPLEPETISAENALFVALGAALTVLIIVGTL